LTPSGKESIKQSILNLRKDWREGFRILLLNMYGVRVNEATPEQLRKALDEYIMNGDCVWGFRMVK